MRESTSYQAILREGAVEARQEDLLAILRDRFQAVPPEVEIRVRSTTDPSRLRDALLRALHIKSPDDLTL